MERVTKSKAEAEGYYEITTAINPVDEAYIVQSIEKSLASVDAVWIEHSEFHLSAARRRGTVQHLSRSTK